METLRSKPNCPLSSLHGGLRAWLLDTHLGGGAPRGPCHSPGAQPCSLPLGPLSTGEHIEGDVESGSGRALAPLPRLPSPRAVAGPTRRPLPRLVLCFLCRPGGGSRDPRIPSGVALGPGDPGADRPSRLGGRGEVEGELLRTCAWQGAPSRIGVDDEPPGLGLGGRAGHPRAPSQQCHEGGAG